MFEELRIDGEVTVKTKNNLILKNTVMGITELEIEEKLSCLHNALNEQLSKEEYRDLILKLIKNEEREIV